MQQVVLKQKSNHKTALIAKLLQKQMSLLKLEEYLILGTFIVGGALGRSLMQGFPSVEPVTFFAVLSGFIFGWRKGALAGAASWWLSNWLVLGGQGPWSLVHLAVGAAAGFLGGVLRKPGYFTAVIAMVSATLLFELVMNISSGFFFGFGVIASFASAIPFALAHIATNAGFALLIPKTAELVRKTGRLDETKIAKSLLATLRRKHETA